jgi:hypothetical protein
MVLNIVRVQDFQPFNRSADREPDGPPGQPARSDGNIQLRQADANTAKIPMENVNVGYKLLEFSLRMILGKVGCCLINQ